jgi:transcriptional regulator with XRE-family HTH domain
MGAACFAEDERSQDEIACHESSLKNPSEVSASPRSLTGGVSRDYISIVMENVKVGQYLNGQLLRSRRYELQARGQRLRLKDIAQRAGYESIHLLSYIERGLGAVTAEHVPGIARAYELDLQQYWLFWSMARLRDDKVPGAVLNHIFDRPELWGDRDKTPNGSPGGPGGQPSRPAVPPSKRGTRSGIEKAVAALIHYLKEHPQQQPIDDSMPDDLLRLERLIRDIM